ncbi:MAG TPA: HI0074 family nucleotidyltransferase substrate-binding subunit [Anaerolineales bacterium]|nr:HI0074 family nucleotidyltransferase substrate-binding subunit [Anaerolineales bacterium]
MERMKERLENALRALATFEKIANLEKPSEIERDAAIQRFEYTFETTWKAAQTYLADQGVREIGSPKSVIRASLKMEMFDEETAQKLMSMVDDRNLTVHTYREEFAVKLYSRLAGHAALLRLWLMEIQKRVG